jgi:sarcosine oxidase
MAKKNFDAIVLGLGAMGSATLYQLAKRGIKVLGIDRYAPPHKYGSTHGDTRITRQAIGEGEAYTPLALRSYEIFRDLESQTGSDLLTVTGGLIISSHAKTSTLHVPGFFDKTIAAAKKFNIRHDMMDSADMRKRFPQFNVRNDERGYFEYEAGFLRPENCVGTQLDLALKTGAQINRDEQVLSFSEKEGGVCVKTDRAEYSGAKLIVTAGPWVHSFVPEELKERFRILRQVLYWFDVAVPVAKYEPEKFPVFIWELQGKPQGIYGFPAIDGQNGGLKIATEQYANVTLPDNYNRVVSDKETSEMFADYVGPQFQELSSKCVKSATCLYTVTPDANFVIDFLPGSQNVILASPCSGHGFKHSAAVGEAISEMTIDGKSSLNLESFGLV